MMFDAVITGSKRRTSRSFAVVFNAEPGRARAQKMSSFAFSYLRFTANLVPTTVKVEMDLEITNMGTTAYATGGARAGPAAPPRTTQPPLPPRCGTPLDRVPGINF